VQRGGSTISTKPIFGSLLEHYRKERNISQPQLCHLLTVGGFPLDVTTVNKYELGTRQPTPQFIFYVVRCLQLNKDEEAALLDAHTADMNRKFIARYMALHEK
jgi:transcriptional regulator with XRE-family HTH domain